MTTPFKKLASFTDIHFGRSSNSEMANYDNLDFIEWFIEKAKAEGCDAIAFLGDYFDNRHQVAVSTLNHGLRGLERLNEEFENIYFIVGNHDLLYRDKRDMSSMAFSKHLSNITLISEPMTFGEGRESMTFLPWLVKDEKKTLKNIKSRYVFMHGELNGFLMNARVPMPEHENGVTVNDFANCEYAFSGHFHFRQARQNVIYIGNPFPFNFADAWDEDRGMMILEWGAEPVFHRWEEQPLYRTMSLSQLLNEPDKMLCPKLTARVTLDLDISFEEAQVVRDEYIKRYSMRKIELVHQGKKNMEQEFSGEVIFQSVDQIVIEGLLSVQSDNFKPERLVEIYRNLNGTT
jgi:DNA repair exonuclease SbcCD nuclease subunit